MISVCVMTLITGDVRSVRRVCQASGVRCQASGQAVRSFTSGALSRTGQVRYQVSGMVRRSRQVVRAGTRCIRRSGGQVVVCCVLFVVCCVDVRVDVGGC
jgi:hypothetical protein